MLLVEIGGTHTRCALSRDGGGPEQVALFRNADYADLETVIDAYLSRRQAAARRAAMAVAAPVHIEPIRVTNLGWTVDTGRLQARFGWADTVLINDFDALACAIPALGAGELFRVRAGAAVENAAIAVLGPGTGLGVSALVPCTEGWQPIGGEGGHVTLAASDEREAELLQALRRRYGHVSAERVLSGPGLLLLYGLIAEPATAASPDAVTRLAGEGDPAAAEALELFFRFLGTVAGDLALTLGALGGVYLGGGILPGLRERLAASGFAARFVDKGRFGAYLADIPVQLILAPTPALRGIRLHPRVSGPRRA